MHHPKIGLKQLFRRCTRSEVCDAGVRDKRRRDLRGDEGAKPWLLQQKATPAVLNTI
jgi:hypothetical protein